MDIDTYTLSATEKLVQAGIVTARLDVLVLMEHVLGVNRAQLLAHPEMDLSRAKQNVLNKLIARRTQHEPLAYVLGKSEFYGREFIITPAVLEPRPESETMIDLLKNYAHKLPPRNPKAGARLAVGTPHPSPARPTRHLRIADVGAGSGALGISVRLEVPDAVVDLLEIDAQALKVAKMNVIKFATSINALRSDLLAQSGKNYDILLCNLPYVPDGHTVNAAALHEPALAIFGGSDGLEVYRKLFLQLDIVRTKPLLILTESLPPQHNTLRRIAEQHGYRQDAEDDFIQAFKLSS